MADHDVPAWGDLVGLPFAYGGRGPDKFDCYGLVREMHRRQGIELPDFISPRDDAEIAHTLAVKQQLWRPCEPAAGAVAAIRIGSMVTHVGYLLDDDQMLHVWQRSGGVCRERLHEWKYRIQGFFRFAQ